MAKYQTLDDIGDVRGKRVLVRVDLNVPMADLKGHRRHALPRDVPTVTELSDKGAIVLLLAHFGRPKGMRMPTKSCLLTIAYGHVLGRQVSSWDDCAGPGAAEARGQDAPVEVAILENTRFHRARRRTIPRSRRRWPRWATSTSTTPSPRRTAPMPRPRGWPASYRLCRAAMEAELGALEKALGSPERPVAAVVGGAKVSTKLDVLTHLVAKVDHLIIGGGMANTFLAARGRPCRQVAVRARSGCDGARNIGARRSGRTARCICPTTSSSPANSRRIPASLRTCNVHEVGPDEMILDVGPAATEALADVLKTCRTLVWNGPMGAFETPPFDTPPWRWRVRRGVDAGRSWCPWQGAATRWRRLRPQRGDRISLRFNCGRRVPRMDGRQALPALRPLTNRKTHERPDMLAKIKDGQASSQRSTRAAGRPPRRSAGTASRPMPGPPKRDVRV
jgi:phosphoglycerate kinase